MIVDPPPIPQQPSQTRRKQSYLGAAGLLIVLLVFLLIWTRLMGEWSCVLIPIWFGGLAFCFKGMFSRPRWPGAVGLALSATLTIGFAYEVVRRGRGNLSARDYPDLIAAKSSLASRFPSAIPPEAKDVRIVAYGVFSLLPSLDDYVEVRYVLPPTLAEAIRERAEAASLADHEGLKMDRLLTADDQDPSTPLPPGFVSYNFPNSASGVTINVTTGEVIYWLIES